MDDVAAILTPWMPAQRWFGGKGRDPELRVVGAFDLATDEPDVVARTLLVRDAAATPTVLYQVPVTLRTTVPDALSGRVIGRVDGDGDAGLAVVDGVHDAAYVRALVGVIVGGGAATPLGATAEGVPAAGVERAERVVVDARVLSGEQSNTSIVVRVAEDGDEHPYIVKVFRALHDGDNPDVVLQSALSAAGTSRVPGCLGALAGEWMDDALPDGARGHLAFAQEFLPGTEDAWRVALTAAADGEDFRAGARDLGAATAEVHGLLAELFDSPASDEAEVTTMVTSWESRLAAAVDEVPELAAHEQSARALYERARREDWPDLQRVHGDYHLGQVLLAPDRGWVLLDFEGEPLRPMVERNRPDIALRDVAGMLRSFDYVAGSVRLAGGVDADPDAVAGAERWAAEAREAFLDGYSERAGEDVRARAVLLAAFELDKALYEAVYERRNRPDWLPIPVGAIERLASA